MKKWLKLNYKYYVVAFVAFATIMIRNVFEYNQFYLQNFIERDILHLQKNYPETIDSLTPLILKVAVENTSGANSQFLIAYPKLFILGFIILHGIMLWGQRNKSEREFLETLPIKREKVVLYRFVMDVVTLIPAVVVACVVTYVHFYTYLKKYDITLPWMGQTMFGYGFTLICYVIFVLGIMYFLESTVVRGDLKIITTAGCMAMFYQSINWLYEAVMFGKDNIFNKFVGFIKMYSVGGKYYKIYQGEWGPEGYWMDTNLLYDVYHQGKEYELSTYAVLGRTCWTDGVVGMSRPSLYIVYASAYLIIGVLLFALATYLTKKQDLAKRSFYFNFAPLMVGLLIFVTVFMFFFVQIPEYWYSCILMGLIAFLGFLYITRGKGRVKL